VTIYNDVEIGDNTYIHPNVTLYPGARIGKNCQLFPGVTVAAVPQDLKFKGEYTTAEIGDNTTLRECVTVHRGTAAKGKTVVGNNNLLMEGVHLGHDVLVGSNCILGNQTKLAGEVIIDDFAILSSTVLVHQFCRIGGYVMIQGGSKITKEVPPYVIAAREPVSYCGLNLVGLRRRGFTHEQIDTIHQAYRTIYQSGLNTSMALERIKEEMEMTPEVEYIVSFVEGAKRGIIRYVD
jgi:UDP-N-acetylglucosamine acyltransferase